MTGRKGGDLKLFPLDYILIEVISHLSIIENWYESIFVKAFIPDVDNMYVARIYRPLNKPVTVFTLFISGAMEYTSRFHTVFESDFNIDVLNNSNVTRKYINTLHQYSFVIEINLQPLCRLVMEVLFHRLTTVGITWMYQGLAMLHPLPYLTTMLFV